MTQAEERIPYRPSSTGGNPVLIGNRYGKLTVVDLYKKAGDRRNYWAETLCECGNTKEVNINNLRNGATTSCGCSLKEHSVQLGRSRLRHGRSNVNGGATKEYKAWQSMKDARRERGIEIAEEWENDFEKFLADVGMAPDLEGIRLTRLDKRIGYFKNNVAWQAPRSHKLVQKSHEKVEVIFG